MAHDSAKGNETQPDVAAVVAPAPGGTLAAYVEHLQSLGRPAVLSRNGPYAWTLGALRFLKRLPLGYPEPPDPAEVRDLLRLRGIWLVGYTVTPNETRPANCLDYICRDPEFQLEKLSSPARRDVRRGLRRFTVRLCTWDEVAEKGSEAHADTLARHEDAMPVPGLLRRMAALHRAAPFYDVWGAWDGDNLAAWMLVIKIDDWALVPLAYSRTEALKDCPNNAILCRATVQYLVKERRSRVSYGLGTVRADVDPRPLHKYKTRMGYEAVALHGAYAANPLLRPALQTRPGSWCLERLSRALPKVRGLRKAAGLSRVLSGRDKDPLAWIREEGGSTSD
jgi:hypothetical protein